METINERISHLIEQLGMTKNAFAKKLGKAQSSVAVVVEGRSKQGFEFLELVCTTFPKLSRDWLLMGEGDMFRSFDHVDSPKGDNYLQEHLSKLEENFNSLLKQLHTKDHQLESKDQQIASLEESRKNLERMLEAVLGKSEGATYRPLSNEEAVYKIRMYEYAMSVFGQPFMQSIFLR